MHKTPIQHFYDFRECRFCPCCKLLQWVRTVIIFEAKFFISNTRSSSTADGPRDAWCQLKSCQLPRNSTENTCTTSPEQIEVMKLEGYRGPMCNKHVHSTMMRSSRFHCLIGVINKPTTDRVVDITCIPTTCCGEIF